MARRLTGDEDARRRKLYDQKLSDHQIAKTLGLRDQSVRTCRLSRELPAHHEIPVSADDEAARHRLYEAKLSDREIAETLSTPERKITTSGIAKWRDRRRLPANGPGRDVS